MTALPIIVWRFAQKYVNKYPDVYRILNKENGGHGSAINEGVKIIKGAILR